MEYMDCDFVCDNKTKIFDFISLTNASEDFASAFLSSNDWNLELSVNKFFESCTYDNSNQSNKSFKIISWNVDGLDNRFVDLRLNSLLNVIKENNPDFVFLQEIINYSEAIIRMSLANYYDFYFDSKHDSYYCGILVKKTNQIKLISDLNIIKFKGSIMERSLLSIIVNVFGLDIKLMTSHLESTKEFSEERKSQLSTAFNDMTQGAPFAIFAGDMNVRDFELRQINSPPSNIIDVCEFLCSNVKQMQTWNPSENTNISRALSNVPGMRFDRMYFFNSSSSNLMPVEFELVGKQIITECDMFTSDHWAISCVFSL